MPDHGAGARLRREMDAALARASVDLGQSPDQPLEWTEQELVALERACATADRSEVLRAAFDAEQAGDGHPSVLVKLSAEVRALDRQVVDLVAKLNLGVGPAVSDRHQRAAHSRWKVAR